MAAVRQGLRRPSHFRSAHVAFPDTWLQAWLWLEYSAPFYDQPPNTYFTASCFWYRLADGTFPSTPSDISDLINNTAQQLWYAVSFGPVQLFNSKVQVYGTKPGGGFAGVVQYGLGTNNWTGYLPSSSCVTMRRRAGVFSDSVQGRFYLPHVVADQVQGGYIDPVAAAQYVDVGSEMEAPVFNATSSWLPIIASYRHVAAYDFYDCIAAQKIALIRKRARPRVWRNSQYLAPKPPPA